MLEQAYSLGYFVRHDVGGIAGCVLHMAQFGDVFAGKAGVYIVAWLAGSLVLIDSVLSKCKMESVILLGANATLWFLYFEVLNKSVQTTTKRVP